MPTPEKKKAKVDPGELCNAAWGYWLNYLDSEEDDSDELVLLLQLVHPHLHPPFSPSIDERGDGASSRHTAADTISIHGGLLSGVQSRVDLLPYLASVAAAALADDHIAEFLVSNNDATNEETDDGNNNNNNNNNQESQQNVARTPREQREACWAEIRMQLRGALSVVPSNPAARSTAANLARAMECRDPSVVLNWYLRAANEAHELRRQALDLLESDAVDVHTKAWIESLILHRMLGVEQECEDDDEEEEEKAEGQSTGGVWSPSAVEATARFMAATLLSRAGRHGVALGQLHQLDVTHRLHPNVWSGVSPESESLPLEDAEAKEKDARIRVFGADSGGGGGLLPPVLYRRLCDEFQPGAPFWRESEYSCRGYYSFYSDYQPGKAPRNAVEETIVRHLLPCVQTLPLPPNSPPIVGFEWWVHTRSTGSSLGHHLHFDTDEALLNTRKGLVEHPVYSAVLYLTGDEAMGATVVLDQTPDAKCNAAFCHRNVPRPNSLLVFPGNLLHGVLPCPGRWRDEDPSRASAAKELFEDPHPPAAWDASSGEPHRLTLMVGFWTRRVPEHVSTHSYGPCGPLPDGASWVQQLERGYNAVDAGQSLDQPPAHPGRQVPKIAPAWEVVAGSRRLPIPRGALDHRFFAKDAPSCFRSSLFAWDEDDGSVGSDDENLSGIDKSGDGTVHNGGAEDSNGNDDRGK